MGIAKENLGYAKEALSDYDTAIKINPNSSSFWFIRGALLYDKGELDKAISDFNNAIKLNPNYTEAYSNRGAVLLSMKKIDESLKDLNKAIELDSTYADAYYNRGIAKYFINDKTGAYNDWELANKLGDEKALTLLRKYCK
jgi:tetratricopeptide (TPR) repeat protein